MRTVEDGVNETPDARAACQALQEAAELIRDDPDRQGSLLSFGAAGQLVVTGDMHGNTRNFDKLQRFCALERSPARRVVLHELIHEEPQYPGAPDFSIDLLVRAARWKCDFPDSVFFLQSNHELSQMCGHEITKGGRSVLHDFERGVHARYGKDTDNVLAALNEYIMALPLAARTSNGIFISHSLPDRVMMHSFDDSVFLRKPTAEDLMPGGSAYALVWGRYHHPEVVEIYAKRFDAQLFLVGHTPQETGYEVVGRMIILASDHAHGVFLPLDLNGRFTVAELERNIRKFVSVE
ncbi:MAG: metallophosphoesterase [Planctomycetes bacterium]|nr:metallophosphoesterase [Planctomycetota bacterium]